MRRFLSARLRKDGYEVAEVANGYQLLGQLDPAVTYDDRFNFDLVISDIRMPGVTGLEMLAGLHTRRGTPRVILMTAFGSAETHAEAERLGALRVFDKPFDVDAVRAFVRGVLATNGHPPSAYSADGEVQPS